MVRFGCLPGKAWSWGRIIMMAKIMFVPEDFIVGGFARWPRTRSCRRRNGQMILGIEVQSSLLGSWLFALRVSGEMKLSTDQPPSCFSLIRCSRAFVLLASSCFAGQFQGRFALRCGRLLVVISIRKAHRSHCFAVCPLTERVSSLQLSRFVSWCRRFSWRHKRKLRLGSLVAKLDCWARKSCSTWMRVLREQSSNVAASRANCP